MENGREDRWGRGGWEVRSYYSLLLCLCEIWNKKTSTLFWKSSEEPILLHRITEGLVAGR